MIAQDLAVVSAPAVEDSNAWTERPADEPAVLLIEVGALSPGTAAILRQVQAGRPVRLVVVDDHDAVSGRQSPAPSHRTGLSDAQQGVLRCRLVGEVAERPGIVQTGELEIDLHRGFVTLRGVAVRLSRTEYRLLEVLAQHAGKTLTARQLLRGVFGPDTRKTEHYLRMYMMLLRRRIETHVGRPRYILTDRNKGYRLSCGETVSE